MKFLRALVCAALLFQLTPSHAFWKGMASAPAITANSEFVPNFLGNSAEYPLLNKFKASANWKWTTNSQITAPDELDSGGYPIPGAAWFSTGNGAAVLLTMPLQAERPGDYVAGWTGGGKVGLTQKGSGASSTSVSCTGVVTTSANTAFCDNTGCSAFTGSIAGTTLTVSAAPTGTGCTLGAGVPISGAGVTLSTFATPTIITSAGSACSANTCYTVNISQTVGSISMRMGARFEVSSADVSTNPVASWSFILANSSSGNPAQNFFVVHVNDAISNDESLFWASATPTGSGQASIVDPLFKTRAKTQANWLVIRGLNWENANLSNCTTWNTRKPVNYYSYAVDEFRNASSGPGQYVNAGGTGASGGTVTFGTDTYSITLGTGGPVDKQTILMLAPATGDTSSLVSLNGTTAVPILSSTGLALIAAYVPTLNKISTLVYDATLGGFVATPPSAGLECGMPPEVFVEIAAELQMTYWHTIPVHAADPTTNWIVQYATMAKANYPAPPALPTFEPINEPWNCSGGVYNSWYVSALAAVYIAVDPTHWTSSGAQFCGPTGNTAQETSKIASTMGQDLNTVFSAGSYELAIPTQTAGATSAFTGLLNSSAYVSQTMAAQSGYAKNPAYQYVTRISVNNYWNTGYYNGGAQLGQENILAYCYFNYSVSTTCQGLYASQAAVMTVKMNSASTPSLAGANIPSLAARLAVWQTFGVNCGPTTRPVGCIVNQTSPLEMYEGGYSEGALTSDWNQSFSTATNASVAVLNMAANGCVAGMTVALSSPVGGTWSTAAGSYTVQTSGTDANHCAINLNSTGLGTLSSATLTYTGSSNYVSYLRAETYLQPALSALQTTVFNNVVSAGGIWPSQFDLAAPIAQQWLVFAFDDYGYFPLASCTSCTIASSTMTLGGTLTGIFSAGQTLFGKGVTGIGTGAGSNTTITSCSTSGSGPCGSNSGDTLGLSQTSTVAVGTTMIGTIAPASIGGGLTSSPVQAFKPICTWNGSSQC